MILSSYPRPARDIIWTVSFSWLRFNQCKQEGNRFMASRYSAELKGMCEILSSINHPLHKWAKNLYTRSL